MKKLLIILYVLLTFLLGLTVMSYIINEFTTNTRMFLSIFFVILFLITVITQISYSIKKTFSFTDKKPSKSQILIIFLLYLVSFTSGFLVINLHDSVTLMADNTLFISSVSLLIISTLCQIYFIHGVMTNKLLAYDEKFLWSFFLFFLPVISHILYITKFNKKQELS